MRTLNIATGKVLATDGSSAAVDLAAQNAPFLPGYSAVIAISLNVAADGEVTVTGSDDAAFGSGVVEYASVDLTGAGPKSGVVFVEAALTKRYIRVTTVEGTTGAGTVDVNLLGN